MIKYKTAEHTFTLCSSQLH